MWIVDLCLHDFDSVLYVRTGYLVYDLTVIGNRWTSTQPCSYVRTFVCMYTNIHTII